MPEPGVVVMKFGGTSVEDAAAFRRVAEIARGAGDRPRVVVTSAMSRGTDALLGAVRYASEGDLHDALAQIEALLERHRAVAAELLGASARAAVNEELDAAHKAVGDLLNVVIDHPGTRLPLQDEIVSYGERLCSGLLAAVLNESGIPSEGVDARQCVRTDSEYTRATPLPEQTERSTRERLLPTLESGRVPVMGGFIGSASDGATTTLGRGGSDYTAALVGAALRAEEIQIWTDVSGFLTADPRVVHGAHSLAHLSYKEAAELAYFGAKVLHPKTIQPAVEHQIPVRVCNSRAAEAPTTLIDGHAEVSPQGIKAIAHKRGATLVQISSARMLGAYGFLRALFEVFDRHRTAVDIVTTSEVSVSLTVDDTRSLPAVVAELEQLGRVTVESGHAILCVVGEGLWTIPGIAARVFSTLSDMNIVLISQGASSINLTFVVAETDLETAVNRLHAEFFGT